MNCIAMYYYVFYEALNVFLWEVPIFFCLRRCFSQTLQTLCVCASIEEISEWFSSHLTAYEQVAAILFPSARICATAAFTSWLAIPFPRRDSSTNV